jgi:hypothetical protein
MTSLLMSQLVSTRVPTCPLECAALGMSDAIFRNMYTQSADGAKSGDRPRRRTWNEAQFTPDQNE